MSLIFELLQNGWIKPFISASIQKSNINHNLRRHSIKAKIQQFNFISNQLSLLFMLFVAGVFFLILSNKRPRPTVTQTYTTLQADSMLKKTNKHNFNR